MEVRVSDAGRHGPSAPSGFFKGVSFVGLLGVLGTLIAAYFQNLSAYQDKVTALAKDDMAAAAQAFTDASTTLSRPLSLQERLIFGYFAAVDQKVDTDDTAFVTRSTRAINGPYEDAYTALRQNINLLARKVEIYLDWPSNPLHDPAINVLATADPINNSSLLGTYNFKCDKDMPAFGKDKSTGKDLSNIELTSDDGKTINLDWYSAKHQALAIYYCFYAEHEAMKPVREWASGMKLDPTERTKYIDRKKSIEDQLNNQVLRLYNFMGLAMNEIDEIRVKYRPNGYWCSVPGVREYFGQECKPIRTAK